MLKRVFAVASDGSYFAGLCALLNSIWVYCGRDLPVFVYHRGLDNTQIRIIGEHPCDTHLFGVSELPFRSFGMWEAKQQIFAHCIGLAKCVYLLDADLVLLSRLDDVFELAEAGKIVSSADGDGVTFDSGYAVYGPRLPGFRQRYINTGAVCLDVVRHWDLAGLWAFACQYGAYSPGAGAPVGLPGHGDQGVFNALTGLLDKHCDFHVLPEGSWCDSSKGCSVQIRERCKEGRLDVWNPSENTRQRLLHSSGPKWWTPEGEAHLNRFGDKLQCFHHFAQMELTVANVARGYTEGKAQNS